MRKRPPQVGRIQIRRSNWLEAIWVFLGNALAATGAILGIRLLTSTMPPDSYGRLSLAMTFVFLCNQLLYGPLAGSALRFLESAKSIGETASFLKAVWKEYVKYSLIISCLALPFIFFLTPKFSAIAYLLIGTLVFALFQGASLCLEALQNAAKCRELTAFSQGFGQILKVTLAAAFAVMLNGSTTAAILGFTVSSLLVLGTQWYSRNAYTHTSQSESHSDDSTLYQTWQKRIQKYSWPLSIWGIFTWVNLASDRWSLTIFREEHEVGCYVVLYQLGFYPITLISSCVLQFASPHLFMNAGVSHSKSHNHANKPIMMIALGLLALTILMVAGTSIFGAYLFKQLVAEEYWRTANLLPLAVLSGGLHATGQALSLKWMIGPETKGLLFPKIATASIGIVTNVLGAYLYGIVGVIVAGLIHSFCYLIWVYLAKVEQSSAFNNGDESN